MNASPFHHRPLACLLVSLSLGLLAPAGCAPRSASPAIAANLTGSLDAISAFYESGPDLAPELSQTPRLVIYGDGHVVIRREDDGAGHSTPPSFWIGELTVDERLELYARQSPLLAEFEPADEDFEFETYPPITTFVFPQGHAAVALNVFGFPLDEPAAAARSYAFVWIKPSVVAYREFLFQLLHTTRDLTPWKPAPPASGPRPAFPGDPAWRPLLPAPLDLIPRAGCLCLCDRILFDVPRRDRRVPLKSVTIDLPLTPAAAFLPHFSPPHPPTF